MDWGSVMGREGLRWAFVCGSVLREQNEADVELRKYTGETYTLDD